MKPSIVALIAGVLTLFVVIVIVTFSIEGSKDDCLDANTQALMDGRDDPANPPPLRDCS